jgi:LPS export ABC transporter protein LptC
MKFKTLIILCIAAVSACTAEPDKKNKLNTANPEQVIENFNMTNRQSGKVLWELSAAKANIFQAKNLIELTIPIIRFYEEKKVASIISGENGTVDQISKIVEVWGNVIIDSKKENTIIKTTRMFYNTELEKIYSNEKVEILRQNSVTKGIGFESDPGLNIITIKENETQIDQKK